MDIRSSNVGILAKSTSHRYAGTGFFVAGGLVLTCAHVIEAASQVNGRFVFCLDGEIQRYQAELLFKSESQELDIAILKPLDFTSSVVALPLVTSDESAGHDFSAFGYPLDSKGQGLHGDGRINGPVRDDHQRTALQLASRSGTHGFSGCPVWDEGSGGVVGMVSSGFDFGLDKKLGEVVFAIPSEVLKDAYPDLTLLPASMPGPTDLRPLTFDFIHQLPPPPADFVGRVDELQQILKGGKTTMPSILVLDTNIH